MKNPMGLEGMRILITGASSGIGRACAVQAAELGAACVLTARRADALEETRARMERPGAHRVIPADLGGEGAAGPLLDEAVRDGRLDGLVHAAGIAPLLPVGILSDAMLRDAMRVNLYAFIRLARGFSRKRCGNPGGSLVAVSSVAAAAGFPGGAAYCASKGAVSAAVRALAMELAPARIRVNAVCPSCIDTPLYRAMEAPSGKNGWNDPERLQPLGLGDPRQVAAPVCFLLSGAASFITGVNLPVDGGYLAR